VDVSPEACHETSPHRSLVDEGRWLVLSRNGPSMAEGQFAASVFLAEALTGFQLLLRGSTGSGPTPRRRGIVPATAGV
jgi:hypothetical protein